MKRILHTVCKFTMTNMSKMREFGVIFLREFGVIFLREFGVIFLREFGVIFLREFGVIFKNVSNMTSVLCIESVRK